MLTDTKTRPEPFKTVDDLWFDLRISASYGNLWERQLNEIANHWQRRGGDLPAEIDALLAELKNLAPRRRPGVNDFAPDEGFATDELGFGSAENYWRTQETFPSKNRKRAEQYAQELEKLAKARQVLARNVRV